MTIAIDQKYYTPEQYLELEEKSEEKHEYRDGEIIIMAGSTTNHNRLTVDFCTYLNIALMKQNAEVFSGDVRLWIPRYRLYTYPDVMVVKGKPVYHPPGTTTITNSSLIVEVLSNSTKSYDQHDKFRYYRSIPQFKEYILLNQYSFLVEQFVKTKDDRWIFNEYDTEEAILKLESVDFQISLKDLYKRVDFNLND
jgi:Uma2 family endonuclease